MTDMFYPGDMKTRRSLLIAILGLQILQNLGLLPAFGFNLATIGIGGFTLAFLLGTVGLLWVLYGSIKHKFA